jgi:hypothetical protein
MQTKTSPNSATPRTYRRTMVSDALYQPIVQQFDRRQYGDAAIDAILAEKGHAEELTEFQALMAMGSTNQALEIVKQVAEQIRPQVLAEARRDAQRSGGARAEAAKTALASGQVSVSTVAPWVRAALRVNARALTDVVDSEGQLFKVLCRYFSHLPFTKVDLPGW